MVEVGEWSERQSGGDDRGGKWNMKASILNTYCVYIGKRVHKQGQYMVTLESTTHHPTVHDTCQPAQHTGDHHTQTSLALTVHFVAMPTCVESSP